MQHGEGSPEHLLTTDDVAERLRLTPRTVKAWRARGRGPEPVRIGYRTVRYRAADVDAWLARHEAPAEQAG